MMGEETETLMELIDRWIIDDEDEKETALFLNHCVNLETPKKMIDQLK